MSNLSGGPLAGKTIALPETRSLDVLAGLLERRGADTWRCPLVGIVDHSNEIAVNEWLNAFIAQPPDWLICLTGEGIRRLTDRANQLGLEEPWLQALQQSKKVTRGPKPAKVLKEMGITLNAESHIKATEPTSTGVISALMDHDLNHQRVGLQCYGDDPNTLIQGFFTSKTAEVLPVFPYQYIDASDDTEVIALVNAAIEKQIDAIAFTSGPQVTRLLNVADAMDLRTQLINGLEACCVAAVGPVVADKLRSKGISVAIQPQESFFMKPLTQALCDHFENSSSAAGHTHT